jgi:F-type H+-transporting ATPase subunit b
MKKNQGSRFKIQFISGLLIFFNFLFVAVAFAGGGGGHGEHEFTWKDWFWPVINFAILVFILVYFGRRPIGEYFRKRTELIEKSLKEATEAKEFAQKALREVQERLKNTDQEVEEILEKARKSGEKEKEAIIAEGKRIKEKIIEQAKANINFELQKAKEKIKSDAAIMALELAEKQLKEKLGPKEQETLIEDYIKRLEAEAKN